MVDDRLKSLERAEEAPRGLMRSIEAGELWLEPGEAERRAAAWRTYGDRVSTLMRRVEQLDRRDGFGDCNIGRLLGSAFALKAVGGRGGEMSTYEALDRLRHIAENMAAAHEAAGRAYREREAENAELFRGIE